MRKVADGRKDQLQVADRMVYLFYEATVDKVYLAAADREVVN